LTGAGVTAPRVVVAGGHSAGHIEPAMNFADALRQLEPTAEITALGTVRGLDTTLIPACGYPLELIPPAPLPRTLNRAPSADAGLDPAWIEATLIPVLTAPERIAAMSARALAAGAPDAGAILARHVLSAVAERRRLAS
jgi:hypothetical protein